MKALPLVAVLLIAACAPISTLPAPPPTAPFYAPDFTLTALDGTAYTLAALQGRWVLVNFWATWCAPCIEEMPALQQLADDHAETLIVLGINQREDAALVGRFIAQQGIRYPILLNPTDSVVLDYNVTGLPQSTLIDPAGIVITRSFGVVDAEALAAYLPPIAPAG